MMTKAAEWVTAAEAGGRKPCEIGLHQADSSLEVNCKVDLREAAQEKNSTI